MKDLYPLILSFADWPTLQNCRQVNKRFYKIAKEEIEKKTTSIYPFGDINGKISVKCNDIALENIHVIIDNTKWYIPKLKYFLLPFIRSILMKWFIFSFNVQKFIIKGKLLKSVIRLCNKRLAEGDELTDVDYTFIFAYKNEEYVLQTII